MISLNFQIIFPEGDFSLRIYSEIPMKENRKNFLIISETTYMNNLNLPVVKKLSSFLIRDLVNFFMIKLITPQMIG